MTTLYYSPGACSLAVHIVLEWIGEPYEAVAVDLHRLNDDFRQLNPAGAVPALDTGDGEVLTQCAAVLDYLARSHPQLDLRDDRSPRHAAELVRWTAFLTGDLHPAFWPAFAPRRYTKSAEGAEQKSVKDAALDTVRAKLALLEQQLQGRDWVVGGKRTTVDAYATPMLRWADAMLPEGLRDFPALRRHRDRMLSDPAVRSALRAEGLPIEREEHRHELT